MVRILITHNNDLLNNFYSLEAVEQLQTLGEVAINGTDEPLRGEKLIAAAKGFEIIISDRLAAGGAEIFNNLPDAVAFMRCAVDIRNIDVAAASRNGILVVRCSAGYAESVAEAAMGFMLALSRRIIVGDRLYKAGEVRHPMLRSRQLAGSTIGIIGYGAIGRRIGDLALAFGMRVLVHDPYARPVHGSILPVGFAELLSDSHFVVCAAYATPETENMMNKAAFAKMRREAYFINIARGIIVDERALEEALSLGQIAGAGLDVGMGDDEQPSLRIAKLANVVAMPHAAALTAQASEHQAFETVRQVREILSGTLPTLAVNGHSATRLSRLAGRS